MSKKYSGRIHDPNHTLSDYDIYFNDDLVSGTGVYTVEEIADIFGSGTDTGNPSVIEDAAPMNPVKLETVKASSVTVRHTNKNVLDFNWGDSKTINGVTFTVNSDGSITANGTASTTATFAFNVDFVCNMNYQISGCPAGGGSSAYGFWVRSTENNYYNDYGSGRQVPQGKTLNRVAIVVISGQTVNNMTFYPMMYPDGITDTTYEQHKGNTYIINPSASDPDPFSIMDYADIELYEGINVIESSSGTVSLEYIKKGV